MKIRGVALSCFSIASLACPAGPLTAQVHPLDLSVQIGGGTCSSATLNGTYSLTLTGRDVNSTLTFAKVLEGTGTATFDGQSIVVFSLTNNTNQSSGVSQMWSGTYSLQANCTGTLTLMVGDNASFSLESYNGGKDYLITGQDATYTFTGDGSVMPTASCSPSQLTGSYSFNGSGFPLKSGAISGANNLSGLLQFDGKSVVTANWTVSAGGTSTSTMSTGQYTISPSCVGSATITDSSGNTSTLQFVVTTSNGSNFLVSGTSPILIFTGSGRTESTTAPCSVSTLTGTYSLVLTGRSLNSSGTLTGSYQGVGTASFAAAGTVVFSLSALPNQSPGAPPGTLSGTWTLGPDCTGAVTIGTGDAAAFTLIAYNVGKNFTITGGDATFPLTGGGAEQPASCSAATISGAYAFSGSGHGNSAAMGSSAISSANSISGLLQFDGRGSVSGSWSVATGAAATTDTVSGQYSMTPSCTGTASVTDPSGAGWTLNFTVTSADGANVGMDIANPASTFSTTGHSTFPYPGLSVVSAASGAAAAVPPGSIFAVYGNGMATGSAQAARVPLPTALLTTGVTVNGEAVPLFFVSEAQINAQMPLDVQPGVASVVVTNGSSTSNTVAVTVPATGVPGVFVQYPTNQGVVQNQDLTENTPAAPAHVGDTVVAYFTGGGPVQAAGPWVTGHASPNGLSQVVESVQVTVGGVTSPSVTYTGLTPTLVGVYQVNFVVPQVSQGNRNLILTINGAASAATTISVAN
jgi:uncharacterized protein (TIGR03437 family)